MQSKGKRVSEKRESERRKVTERLGRRKGHTGQAEGVREGAQCRKLIIVQL